MRCWLQGGCLKLFFRFLFSFFSLVGGGRCVGENWGVSNG